MNIRRALSVAVVVSLAVGLLVVVSPSATAAIQPRTVPAGPIRTVTLVTGDVVGVSEVGGGKLATDVTRPHGAPGGVRAETIGRDLYVLPDEAMPYLAAGVLDRRLFDVTELLADGYDDQHSDGIPLIVTHSAATPSSANPAPAPAGTTIVRQLPSIRGQAVRAPKKKTRDVWRSLAARPTAASTATVSFGQNVAKVWLDAKVHASLAESTAQIGAPAAWAQGLDGTGVTVAILDTGVDAAHPDLAGQVTQAVSFVPGQSTNDGNGHGTHTASTIVGTGAASGGVESGVARGAKLLVGKVLGDDGSGDDSWVIAGMEWAAHSGAKVISMSLGGSDPSDGTDPMSLAVDDLTTETGALFVIAAGNTGSEAGMSAPGAADAALTVGAVDGADQLAYFSSMGPRYGDYGMKPDITAPGVDILAARAGGNAQDGYYQTMSGTSMATPHVAGAAAILVQEHPDWSAPQLKDALMSTSKPLPYTAYQVGAGRVDVAASIAATVTATGSTYFGFQAWPHISTDPVNRTVTYSNSGADPVTLSLNETATVAGGPYDVDPTADAGSPAPAGMFTLAATQVTVPAHGATTVIATAHPNLGANGRRYLGQIVATDPQGTVEARTQIGLYVEDERYTLHISVRDRAGQPVGALLEFQMFGVDGDPVLVTVPATGEADVRLRAGTYSAFTYVDVAGSHGPDSVGLALLGDPEIVMDHDRTLTLDARQAVEVKAEVPDRTEDRTRYLDWYRADSGGVSVIGVQYLLPATYDSMFALPTKKVTTGSFEFEARWRKAYPLLTLSAGPTDIAVLAQAGSGLFDGKNHLDTVAVGSGTPAEYQGQDVAGKAVIVTRSDALTEQQQAAAAAAAQAKLLVVVNDGPGKLFDWVGSDDGGYSTVPVVSVTARVGAPLLAQAGQGRLWLDVVGVPDSPFVYDLAAPYPGQIPADLTYRPEAKQLATVDMVFHGDTRYDGAEYRWDYRPYRQFAFGFIQRMGMPGTRVDYVSAQPGTAWASSAISGPQYSLVSVSDVHAYAPGSRVTDEWFGPVTRPRDGGGFWSSTRYDGFAQLNVQPWADGGGGHAGYLVQGDNLTMTVYQDGALVATSEGWASASLFPPPGQVTYTVDLQASRDPSVWRLSPRTHTVWTVVSRPVASPDAVEIMPFLQLDYDVATDLAGNGHPGQQQVGLRASHLDGAVGTGRILGMTLDVSFDDGATWRPAQLSRAADGWSADFQAPNQGYVSLRASAWDSAGNKITQEVIRAYGLQTSR
jgi:subtilisin family serine protease